MGSPWLDHDVFVMARAAKGLRARGRREATQRLDAAILRLVQIKATAYFDALDDDVAATEARQQAQF